MLANLRVGEGGCRTGENGGEKENPKGDCGDGPGFFSWPLSDRLLGERGDRSDYRLITVEVVPLVSENAGNCGKASDHQADNC